ncbi:small G protein signaling modulator 1-like isoform X2 [Daphnia pulex]|uniref:small G protein signaling modulator 1-like isoform X2 n=1 Tax=Daphnia pulex TaxID=6669 RepID=UPI001EE15337|nr:small G protein signaling modulator 1-like isoform X2 [Daphnia pulex]
MKMAHSSNDKEFKERLIKTVKKEVKQIMEEAVTRKFVHQDSSSVTSLCAAVEGCLSHGLRRRALGLFRSSSTTALMHKVAKIYPPAAVISKLITEADSSEGVKRSSSSGDSITRMLSCGGTGGSGIKPILQKRNSGSWLSKGTSTQKYLWIRLALFERILAGIIEHIVENHLKYYENDALVADPEYGSLLGHLLAGPCALEFTKLKTKDHYWTDPPADELVQRHRISSYVSSGVTSPANRRPGLHYRKLLPGGSSSDGESISSMGSRNCYVNSTAKNYVESLHQNNKVVLLYGKNNVLVLSRELTEPIPGYLSLHHAMDSLTLKWTPNQLMNGGIDFDGVDKSTYWNYALHVNLYDIVYVHCHQKGFDVGGSMVLVGQDGVQYPAIHFPAGGHLLAFLTCLETGLNPRGRLDPPLWTQTDKGKTFPKIKRKGPSSGDNLLAMLSYNAVESNGNDEDITDESSISSDYVFRIVTTSGDFVHDHNPELLQESSDENAYLSQGTNACQNQGSMSPRWWSTNHSRPFNSTESTSSSSSSSKSFAASLSLAENTCNSVINSVFFETVDDSVSSQSSTLIGVHNIVKRGKSLQVLCETMKRQIISRAFYGWLGHCRHLRTVRTHLSGLVNDAIISRNNSCDENSGVNEKSWSRLVVDGVLSNSFELFRLTYYGGVEHNLRKEVWPYLLGHYPFGSTIEERHTQDRAMQTAYESTMSEWLAVEAIIRQRDKEITAASIAKISFGSQSGDQLFEDPVEDQSRILSNEVFDSEDLEADHIENDKNEDKLEDENDVIAKHPYETIDEKSKSQDCDVCPSNVTMVKVITTHPPSCAADDIAACIDFEIHRQTLLENNGSRSLQNGSTMVADISSTKDTNLSLPNLIIDDGMDRCSIGSRSSCVSPVSSQGGIYTAELLEKYGLNLHRIDKDVQRCDRNYHYFTPSNLDKLRNIMCTYVWCHLDIGYMQGMCDLVAPLLVIIEDEALTYSCFCELMKRMSANFPQGGAMDLHFANMRSLIQILDGELFDLMHQNGDYTHFYFCYRWFLLDFKRELIYEDVFLVWETIWAARSISSPHFVLFVALALVQHYREIILANAMDFTDIIKFFNEMAERHDTKTILQLARDLVLQLQVLIGDK